MYQPEQDIDDLISGYIQAPHDPLLQEQIAAFRNEGPGQAAYLESRLAAWLAEGVTVPEGEPSFAISLPPRPVLSYRWLMAAVALIMAAGGLLYFYRQAPAKQIQYANNTGHIDTLLPALGCTVIADRGASLSYAAGFAATPEIYMQGGNTWFDVALPVRVRMQLDEHTDLYALNAVFTVHKTNTIFKILVIKGKVTLLQDKGKKVYLTANMIAKRERHQPLQFRTVRSQSLLAWKTGRLSFRNTSLEEVIDALNSYHHLDIQVPPSAASLYKRSLTVDFENKSADETLASLQRALNVPLVKDSGNRYYITLK